MPDKSVELRLILSGIFLMNDFFDKCSVFRAMCRTLRFR